MIIDGKKLAEKIKVSLKEKVSVFPKKCRLAIIKVGSNAVTEKFIEQKSKFAKDIDTDVRIYEFPETISTNQLRKKVSEIVHIKENSGVIIQLPLPREMNADYILDALTPIKDPDMLSSKSLGFLVSGRSKILPPVVAAIKYIFDTYEINLKGKKVAVVGSGRLVGKPAAIWLMNQGATVSILGENTLDIASFTKDAGIVISGVGKSKLITLDMVQEGAVVIDCGASELAGKISGDIDPGVAEKASLFSPVPGGIGPLTVAMLFKNLLDLHHKS